MPSLQFRSKIGESSHTQQNDVVNASTAAQTVLSVEFLSKVRDKARVAAEELTSAQRRALQDRRSVAAKGSLALAVSHSQKIVKLLDYVRGQVDQEKLASTATASRTTTPAATPVRGVHGGRAGGGAPLFSSSSSAAKALQAAIAPEEITTTSSSPSQMIAMMAEIETSRAALRRALPRAICTLEASGGAGGDDEESAAASTAASLRHLMRTRALLSMEMKKVETAVQEFEGSSDALGALNTALLDVHGTMEMAQKMVRQLLKVQSRDDVCLRVSVGVFVLVVLYIIAQRVFGFFPVTVYVSL